MDKNLLRKETHHMHIVMPLRPWNKVKVVQKKGECLKFTRGYYQAQISFKQHPSVKAGNIHYPSFLLKMHQLHKTNGNMWIPFSKYVYLI